MNLLVGFNIVTYIFWGAWFPSPYTLIHPVLSYSSLLSLRSKAQIQGISRDENLFNVMKSELHRARQFNRVTAAKSSRMFSWMAAQQDFVSECCKQGEKQTDALQPCRTFRPICSDHKQVVLYKQTTGGVFTTHLGVVFSVFRGAVSRITACARNLKVSKCLGMNAPAEAVAKILVVDLQLLEEKDKKVPDTYLTNLLATAHLLVPSHSVICEVPIEQFGEKNGVAYFSFSEATMGIIGKIQDGTLDTTEIFNSKKVLEVPEVVEKEVFGGYTPADFAKGPAGRKNIIGFMTRLPAAFDSKGLKLLDNDGCYKLRA